MHPSGQLSLWRPGDSGPGVLLAETLQKHQEGTPWVKEKKRGEDGREAGGEVRMPLEERVRAAPGGH